MTALWTILGSLGIGGLITGGVAWYLSRMALAEARGIQAERQRWQASEVAARAEYQRQVEVLRSELHNAQAREAGRYAREVDHPPTTPANRSAAVDDLIRTLPPTDGPRGTRG